MNSWLNPENCFFSGIRKIVDLIWLSMLWTVCSLPIVTIGTLLCSGKKHKKRPKLSNQRIFSWNEGEFFSGNRNLDTDYGIIFYGFDRRFIRVWGFPFC